MGSGWELVFGERSSCGARFGAGAGAGAGAERCVVRFPSEALGVWLVTKTVGLSEEPVRLRE